MNTGSYYSESPRSRATASNYENNSTPPHRRTSSTGRGGENRGDSGGSHRGHSSSSSSRSFNEEESEEAAVQRVIDKREHVKDMSVESTRRTLQRLQESEAIGSSSLERLHAQSEKLARVETQMLEAECKAAAAANKAAELERLNRNFLVAGASNKLAQFNIFAGGRRREKKLRAEVEAARTEAKEAAEEAENAASAFATERDRENELNSLAGRHGLGSSPSRLGNGSSTRQTRSNRMGDEEFCVKETEIDNNLDAIGSALARVKGLAINLGDEVNKSTAQINRITARSDTVKDSVDRTGARLNRK